MSLSLSWSPDPLIKIMHQLNWRRATKRMHRHDPKPTVIFCPAVHDPDSSDRLLTALRVVPVLELLRAE